MPSPSAAVQKLGTIGQAGSIDDRNPLDCATAVHQFIRDRLAAGPDLEGGRNRNLYYVNSIDPYPPFLLENGDESHTSFSVRGCTSAALFYGCTTLKQPAAITSKD